MWECFRCEKKESSVELFLLDKAMYPLKPGTHRAALAAHTLKARFDRSYEIITFGSDRYVLRNITLTRRSIRKALHNL